MRLVRIVVDSAVEVPVALELFGDAKGIVGAAEVGRLVAIVARFHFRPHGPEPSPAGHFVGQNEPVRENTTFYAQKRQNIFRESTYVTFIALPSDMKVSCSSLSFSPQISTGGSSSLFQTRTAAAAHPRAVNVNKCNKTSPKKKKKKQKENSLSCSPSMENDSKWRRMRWSLADWTCHEQLRRPELRSYLSGHLGLVNTPLAAPGTLRLLPQSAQKRRENEKKKAKTSTRSSVVIDGREGRKEGRKRGVARGASLFRRQGNWALSLSLTSIDRDVLVEHVPGLEAVKDAFFVRVQDNLRKSRDSVAALAPIAGQAKKNKTKGKKKWSKTFKPIVPGSDSTGPGNASPQ